MTDIAALAQAYIDAQDAVSEAIWGPDWRKIITSIRRPATVAEEPPNSDIDQLVEVQLAKREALVAALAEHNSRLNAAAPDLLAACRLYLRDDIDANDAPLIEDAIRQAVAKAEDHG